jgi:hypothetical protein
MDGYSGNNHFRVARRHGRLNQKSLFSLGEKKNDKK